MPVELDGLEIGKSYILSVLVSHSRKKESLSMLTRRLGSEYERAIALAFALPES